MISEDGAEPARQWEIRAALRAYSRTTEDDSPHPAEQILTAALELVREQDDFTVKQLSERAGVALQTFYRHFGTKDELILAMMEENIARGEILRRADEVADPVERLHFLVTAPLLQEYGEAGRRTLRWAARERTRLRARYPKAVFDVQQPFRYAVQKAIEAVVEAGGGVSRDPVLDATIVQHEVMTLTHLTHGGGLDADPAVVAERIWELFWKGFAVTKRDGRS